MLGLIPFLPRWFRLLCACRVPSPLPLVLLALFDHSTWPAWQGLMRRLGDRVRVVGDDLLVTNAAHVQRAAETRSANSVLVKVNQIGTLSETFETMRVAEAAGFTRIVSARSGETEDSTIADLAVGTTADHM